MRRVVLLACMICVALPVSAEFKFGPSLGIFNGFGAAMRVGSANLGLELNAGYKPILMLADSYDTADGLELLSTADFGAAFYAVAGEFGVSRFHPGVLVGGRYNTLLGAGAALAFKGIVELDTVTLDFMVGALYYPDGDEEVLEEKPEYYSVSDWGTVYDFGIGVNIMF